MDEFRGDPQSSHRSIENGSQKIESSDRDAIPSDWRVKG